MSRAAILARIATLETRLGTLVPGAPLRYAAAITQELQALRSQLPSAT